MSGIDSFHFLRPVWFIALVPAALLVFFLLRQSSAGSVWDGVVDTRLLKHLWLQTPGKLRRLPIVLLGLGWLLAVIALAGPVWEQQPQPVFNAQTARVIVLDLSDSMNATDIKPSRLMRARFKISDILNRSREGRTALVVFAAEPHLVTPLTDDTATLAAMLPALTTDIMPVQGNAGSAALQLAAELLKNAGEAHGEVLLMTDGIDDQAAMISSIRALRGQGYRLSILGIGGQQAVTVHTEQKTQTVSGLNASLLTNMAQAGGGAYSELTADDLDLKRVLLSPHKAQMHVKKDQGSGVERWIERGGWLLPLLLVLAASGLRRGWLGVLLCSVLIVPPPAQAWEWSDLWLNQEQRAVRDLKNGKAKQAIQEFKNQAWKGVAQHAAGDFKTSAKTFEQLDSVLGSYNRGNSLARMGQLEEAAKAYRDTLAKAPDHADAKFNLELVEKLLKQQQDKNKQQNKNKQRDGGKGDQKDQDKKSDSRQGEKKGKQKNQEKGSESKQGGEQQQGHQEKQGQSAGASSQDKQDSAAKAKQDVEGSRQNKKADKAKAPGKKPGSDKKTSGNGKKAQAGEQSKAKAQKSRNGKKSTVDSGGQKNEKEIALEQWLQQIPDDPGGLLRRKFMLEYINRQKAEGVRQ